MVKKCGKFCLNIKEMTDTIFMRVYV